MAYVPFPVGTVRGPYTCGHGNNHSGGVQFMVKGPNGWVPFIEACGRGGRGEVVAREKAEKYAAKIRLEAQA